MLLDLLPLRGDFPGCLGRTPLFYGPRVSGLGFPKAFPIAVLDELGQGDFPGFLAMIGQAAEFLGVHPQFPRHLDLGVREPILRARCKPRLQLLGNSSVFFAMMGCSPFTR